MNYIELINQFWKMRRGMRLTSTEADLYYFLMQESNIRGWENPFECSNGLVASTIGITEKTLIDVRQRLAQKGLISFEPGQRKRKSPVYTLLVGRRDARSVAKPVAQKKSDAPKRVAKEKAVCPSLEDVDSYCNERGNTVDPQKFIDFYTAKNWMIGKNKMKDWRAAVRTWENRDKDDKQKHPATDYSTSKTRNDARW